MKKFNISRLNKRVTFGNYGNTGKINPNTGEPIKGFQELQTVWCGNYSMTANQTITLAGLANTGVRMIVIRHNTNVANATLAKVDGTEYSVTAINSDDGVNTFDLVTLTQTAKRS